MAEVQWIKITVNMFDNRKIKHLRRLPDGDSIVLIWVMLLTMAGRCNAGGMIFLTENIPYTPKMLANELDFEESTVQLALKALEELDMVSTTDTGFLLIDGWEEHQNTAGMEKIRESKRLAQARWRAKKKELPPSVDSTVDSTVDTKSVSVDYAEEDKDKNKNKIIYKTVVDYLNEKAGTRYKSTSSKTKTCIHARLEEGFTLDDFKTVIDKKCTDWIGTEWEKFLRPETLFGTKFEGYLNAKPTKGHKPGTVGPNGINIDPSLYDDDLLSHF